ncbi:hypothetical protein BDV96DRAFT_481046 [Lophiotrema nucula]|uniref:Uncharacterized protein n=1 Tax=Lophiotrema nucula TaxID=690887 RepID=A0A6A5ZU82_9PLEO|nr:hypothetical protein BDV96DRAFT_481046 [Lophiotrema nucula]
MDAALSIEEIAALSDPDRALEASARLLADSTSNHSRSSSPFEESLRLKNTLDVFEEQARQKPSWERLSVLVNCEWMLWKLNEGTEIRLNPFLSHWVEAVQRFDGVKLEDGEGGLGGSEIGRVRCEVVKGLLKSGDSNEFARLSPRELHRKFVELKETTPLDTREYIRMLEEEGIYERGEASSEEDPAGEEPVQLPGPSKGKEAVNAPKLNGATKKRWNDALLDRLEIEPDVAITEIVHLPIELASLDFLTTLLEKQTLQRLSTDPSPVITGYVQHALRLAEKMGQPPNPTSPESQYRSEGLPVNGTSHLDDAPNDHGRAAQSRAIKLLLLFIRNLIRKALLPPDALYFEIQEICVRYVWIKEVREFKAFVEGSLGGEGLI